MSVKETETQWGVLHVTGRVERIDPSAAVEGYMTAEEAAHVRAARVGGKVVSRTRTVKTSRWKV